REQRGDGGAPRHPARGRDAVDGAARRGDRAARLVSPAGVVEAFGLGDLPWRARYDALFAACPAAFVQQSSPWAEAIAPLGPDRVILLLFHDGTRDVAGLPLYLFEGPSGPVLTSVPQPGPLGGVFVRPGLAE